MLDRFRQNFSWGRIAGFLLLAGLLSVRIADPIVIERMRLQVFDLYQRLLPREAQKFPIAIIDIDDRSLSGVGQWPWPRTIVAELTERAMQAGAVAVAFDIVFSEPDRLSPARIAEDNKAIPEELRAALSGLPSNDEVLARTFERSRVIVGQTSVRSQSQSSGSDSEIRKVPHAIIGPDPTPFLIRFPDLVQNLPLLENAASGRGLFTVRPDPDGVYRRVPVVMTAQGAVRLGLSIELLRVATGGNAFGIRTNDAGIEGIVVANQFIETQGDGTVWPRFSYSDQGRFVSAVDLLEGKIPAQRLAGHLVLVGTSAIGLEDFRATPLGIPMAGVEIHAQLLENILGGTLLKRSNTADAQEMLWFVGMSALVIALAPALRASWLIVFTIVLVISYGALSYVSFSWNGKLLDPSFPIIGTMLTVMLMSSTNYLREERRKRQIRSAFGQYVSPELVANLADHPEELQLGGERRDLSVLFSDVRSFTSLSEAFRDDPQGLTRLMNRFLTILSTAIMDTGGTIDKFMGDAVMAFWNAPLDDPKHAENSCRAALNILDAVEDYNRERQSKTKPGEQVQEINMGVAVNTGPCFVGNMGTEKRFDYTALGDTVNIASRLEGQTKDYGVSIIVGNGTAESVEGNFALIELDLIRVKGRSEPERIYGLLGDKKMADDRRFQALAAAVSKMLAAYRAQDWKRAQQSLNDIEKFSWALGLDLSNYCRLFRDRARQFETNPPDPDWDGVYDAKTK